jgi:glycosyltransferase involved in cell wall biosynthesis
MNPISLVWYSFLASLNIIGLRKKGLKIVVTTDILTGVFPMLLSKLLRIKVIFSEGNLWPWVDTYTDPKELSENQKLMYSITIIASKFLRRLATRIRVQSNSIKEGMVRNGVPRERIDVVEGGVCVNEFIPASRIRPRDLNVGFIGRLTDEKGGSLLFKVCATAEKEIPDVNFLIYGDGSYRSSFELLRNVKHVGWVPRNRLAQLLSEIDVVMFFQRDLGIAVLEAMASGKAIVACDIGEISKVVQHLENGILCSANVNSCVDGIRLLYNNPLLIEKLSKKARETAINRFDWAVIGAKWINLCKECLETSNLDKTCSAGH